jgi:tetratricopeptide (TPR) repeat protein/transcriptional regulator with XRE-family HTH domain
MTAGSAAFGTQLSTCRRLARLSQQELAERSGLSVRTISNLERGRSRRPYPDTVSRLAGALELSAEVRAEFAAAAGRRLAGGRADPAIAGLSGRLRPAVRERIVPRQLPGPVRQFTGRRDELAALTGVLGQTGAGGPGAALISVIGGMAGVGKTALAVHWAHHVACRFPDGQLYMNLRGYDPLAPPVPAGDALACFLRALGIAGQDIPGDVAERAAAYRSLLAGRRFLVMLDNARHADQVRPLLPGSTGCVTVVTSRDALGGLVARDGAVRLNVGLLSLREAVDLLLGLIGSRVENDPDAAAELAEQCGRLPLALRVAAQLAIEHDGVTLADLTAELADLGHRLDLLETGGDERTSVRSVFTWSYHDLDPAAAAMFRLVGVHPGPHISSAAAASLAGVTASQARRALGDLTRAHLLHEYPPGRFGCHDLLRALATEPAAVHDGPARRTAVNRVLDHYLHTACAADRVLHPSRVPLDLPAPQPGTLPENPADPNQALAWFDAEHNVLIAAITHAAASGLHRYAWQLAWSVATFLDLRAHWDDLIDTQRTALAAATALQDQSAQALAHYKLAVGYLLRGQHHDAAAHLEQGLELFRQHGDRVGEAGVRLAISLQLEWQNQYAAAVREDELSLSLFRAAGDRAGQARALNAVGWHLALRGRHHQALSRCQQALALQRELGDMLDEANTWDSLGYIHDRLHQHDQAIACYQHALHLLGPIKERHRQAIILDHLGDTYHHADNPEPARDAWHQALAILADIHHPDAQNIAAKLTTRP